MIISIDIEVSLSVMHCGEIIHTDLIFSASYIKLGAVALYCSGHN